MDKYQGARTLDALKQFVDSQLQKFVDVGDEEEGRVDELVVDDDSGVVVSYFCLFFLHRSSGRVVSISTSDTIG